MFKVSALSSGISQDLCVAARFVRASGLDGLDLDRVWGQPIELLADTEDAASLQRVLTQEGGRVLCLGTTLFRCWPDSEAGFQEHLGRLEACLRLAERLGGPLVRCYAFLRSGRLGDPWPRLLERFQEAAELAGTYGLTLGVQNDAQTYLGTGREVAQLVEAVRSVHFRAVWDPCAAVFDMDNPEIPYPDGYRRLQQHIAHVVLRDVDRHKHRGTLREVEFGEGLVDHRRQIQALLTTRYTGAVSLAMAWRPGMAWDRDPDEADFTEVGAQQAIRIALANLRAMMNAT